MSRSAVTRYVVDPIIRFFAGRDVFISYARLDAVRYAPALARKLREVGISSYLDQWAAPPDAELPDAIKRALRWSSVLVVVVGKHARESRFVAEEVELFIPTQRPVIPIIGEGECPPWIPKAVRAIETSTAIEEGKPSEEVLARIRDTVGTVTQSRRLNASALFAVVLLALAGGSVVMARLDVKAATKKTEEQVKLANSAATAKSLADSAAEGARRDAEARTREAIAAARARDVAAREAERQRAVADAIAKANDASTLLQREPAAGAQAAVLATEAMRSLDRMQVQSVAADTAIRDAFRLLPAVDRTITLDTKEGQQVALSPDGRFIAAERERGMDLFDTRHGTSKNVPFEGVPADALRTIAFSADGSTIAAVLVDGQRWLTPVWSTESRRLLSQIEQTGSPEHVRAIPMPGEEDSERDETVEEAVALSADGHLLATHLGSVIRVWDTATGEPLGSPITAYGTLVRLLFSPKTARYLAIGGSELRVLQWREGKECSPNVDGFLNLNVIVAFSPDERFIGFAGGDRMGASALEPFGDKVWEAKGMVNSPSLLAFTADSEWMVAADQNQVAVYQAYNGVALWSFSPGGTTMTLSDDRFLLGAQDGTVRLYDLYGDELARAAHTEPVLNVAFVDRGKSVVTSSVRDAKVWHAEGPNDPSWSTSSNAAKTMAVSPDRASIATFGYLRGAGHSSISMFDARSGAVMTSVPMAAKIVSLAFAGSRNVVATDTDRKLHVWNLTAGHLTEVKPPNIGSAEWAAASADGKTLAISAGNSIILCEHWRTSTQRVTTLSHTSAIRSMAFDETGARLIAGTIDGGVFVWDWRRNAQAPLRRFHHGGFVSSITCAGRLVVTTGGEAAKVWDLRRNSSDPIAVLRSAARVWSTSIEPNTNVLAVVSADGLLRLWSDWSTTRPREVVRIRLGAAKSSDALQVAFVAGGRFLISRQEDTLQARLWRAPDLLAATCQRLRRNVDERVWSRVCERSLMARDGL